ncbi:hypothetical protein JCM10213_005675 [Rhodosporidiobolus nylandii]
MASSDHWIIDGKTFVQEFFGAAGAELYHNRPLPFPSRRTCRRRNRAALPVAASQPSPGDHVFAPARTSRKRLSVLLWAQPSSPTSFAPGGSTSRPSTPTPSARARPFSVASSFSIPFSAVSSSPHRARSPSWRDERRISWPISHTLSPNDLAAYGPLVDIRPTATPMARFADKSPRELRQSRVEYGEAL